jgi:flavin reductase (DIM6/NTAB) family NADH-FMN oxidoreductase RutF
METVTFLPAELATRDLHGLLLGGIAPRPIALASTVDGEGRPNLAPFSYFNVFSASPPVVIFSPARRGKDGTTKHTYENVRSVPEVVINLVSFDMVHATSLASSDFPAGVSEFEKAGLTPVASDVVKPFRVAESPLALECKVMRVEDLAETPGAGSLVICEVLRMHFRADVLDAARKVDPWKMDLVGRCGGDAYVRAAGDALFEVPKPLAVVGIGVDQIPADIRTSSVLTNEDLARLATVAELPDETDVNEHKLLELSDIFMEFEGDGAALEQALHRQAAEEIHIGDVDRAWKTLLSFNAG